MASKLFMLRGSEKPQVREKIMWPTPMGPCREILNFSHQFVSRAPFVVPKARPCTWRGFRIGDTRSFFCCQRQVECDNALTENKVQSATCSVSQRTTGTFLKCKRRLFCETLILPYWRNYHCQKYIEHCCRCAGLSNGVVGSLMLFCLCCVILMCYLGVFLSLSLSSGLSLSLSLSLSSGLSLSLSLSSVLSLCLFPEEPGSSDWPIFEGLQGRVGSSEWHLGYTPGSSKTVPYRLVYKTHFFAPNSDIKRRGASYTWVCSDCWDTMGKITIQYRVKETLCSLESKKRGLKAKQRGQ